MKKEQKRWRAEEGNEFYYIKITHEGVGMYATWEESFDDYCQLMYDFGNYFRNKEEAQYAIDDIQKLLLRHSGELHDFTWAIEKLRKGKILLRKSWLEEGETTKLIRIHYDCLQDLSDKMRVVSCDKENTLSGMDYVFFLEDIKATDWEIFEE